jgi:hypothetical protein
MMSATSRRKPTTATMPNDSKRSRNRIAMPRRLPGSRSQIAFNDD